MPRISNSLTSPLCGCGFGAGRPRHFFLLRKPLNNRLVLPFPPRQPFRREDLVIWRNRTCLSLSAYDADNLAALFHAPSAPTPPYAEFTSRRFETNDFFFPSPNWRGVGSKGVDRTRFLREESVKSLGRVNDFFYENRLRGARNTFNKCCGAVSCKITGAFTRLRDLI
ncbi:hypothetical protein NPIL_564451 [Nephila pilipes]|uniref:Uncharacterized protein n=1 Tax=Nephila pilipes TaxID=299642 RepID=A0A8X6U4B4_NEPPI|nr:hypothetical protein NPIL_564451 [Nephila pilipes]